MNCYSCIIDKKYTDDNKFKVSSMKHEDHRNITEWCCLGRGAWEFTGPTNSTFPFQVQKVLQLTLATEDILHHLDNALQQMQRFVLGGYGNYSRDKQFVYHAMHVWRHANEIEELRRRYCYLPIKIVDALLYQGRYRESLEYAEEQYEVLMDKLGQDHHSTLAMLFNKARYDV